MDHFHVRYQLGGMGLNHSSWWVVESVWTSNGWIELPRKYLRQSDYS